MSENNIQLTVVIPCFNERGAIVETITKVREVLGTSMRFEMVVVNDGSTDGSDEAIGEQAATHDDVVHIRHAENRGYGAALKSGIGKATAEIIAIIDADGSYPIDRLPDLVDGMKNADMVVGARTGDDVTYSTVRRIPKQFLIWYGSWISNRRIPDINSGMRVFRKSVVKRYLHILPNTFSFTMTITLAMLTDNREVEFLPINYSARVGDSKIKPIRDTLRFCQLIFRTGIYFAPLRAFLPIVLLSGLGFVISLGRDVFVEQNITDKTIILMTLTLNIGLFALLADLIDKRTQR